MLQLTDANLHTFFCMLVNHDEAAREFANTAGAKDAVKMAQERGWTVVSMKQDWRTVFASEEQ